uniref:Uncharacterized protein n=1 Tax=uncultured marine group II euryarchaeote 37F11 TaxID=133822 RepID=Q9P9B6_9ARCH|nr:unknown [uncultured marine group II euryarchaeote 37F11]
MGGRNTRYRTGLFLLSILILCQLPLNTHADESPIVFVIDERVQMITLDADTSHDISESVSEGDVISVAVGCDFCSVSIEENGSITTSTSIATVVASEAGLANISISSVETETITTSILVAPDTQHPSQRPAPEDSFDLDSNGRCISSIDCIDVHRGNLNTISTGSYSSDWFESGLVRSEAPEYWAIEVLEGDLVEFKLHHTSDNIRFDFSFQNSTIELPLPLLIESATGTNPDLLTSTEYIDILEDGRLIVKISTTAAQSAYALQRSIHSKSLTQQIDDNTFTFTQIGHTHSQTAFSFKETNLVKLAPMVENIKVELTVKIGSDWILMPEIEVSKNTVKRIYAYPNSSMAMLKITSDVHWVDVSIESFSDGNISMDAPSFAPTDPNNIDAWPVLTSEDTARFEGSLTLPAMDQNDVYLLSVDGWVDSLHRVHIVIRTTNQDLVVNVWELDQETFETKSEYLITFDPLSNEGEVYLNVGPGMHLIEFAHADENILSNQTWSNGLQSVSYTITTTKVTTEEGEEPWFPPSDEAKLWGSAVRWILGIAMIIPAVFLFYKIKSTRAEGRRLGAVRERLKILTALLDSGSETQKRTRKTLVKSLEAVATLPWQSACESWGIPDRTYSTQGTSLAIWKLDQRLSKEPDSWPLLIGLHTPDETWEVSGFRFDAPNGNPWNVVNVEPRLLHRGEEIFIDTIAKGTMIFLTVELSGDGDQVDIELNGHVDGSPRGMKIPTTLSRSSEEE